MDALNYTNVRCAYKGLYAHHSAVQ